MGTRKVLVIDDEIIWRNLLGRLLPPLGCEVAAAGSCAEGIRLAAELRPDCIVLDFNLRDGDAVDVCKALHACPGGHTAPVVIFSSDPAAEAAAYGECGAFKYVPKGACEDNDLCSAVAEALSLSAQ